MSDSMIVGITSGTAIHDQLADLEVMLRTTIEMQKLKRIKAVAVKSVLPLGICFLPAFIMLAVIPMVAGMIGNFTK
jgi:pilus assembly protein TadC